MPEARKRVNRKTFLGAKIFNLHSRRRFADKGEEVEAMKKHTNLVTRCADILKKETALLECLAATQEVVRTSVFARDWTDLDAMLSRLDLYGKEFEQLEIERASVFGELGGNAGESAGFYALVSRLDVTARKELADLYRKLKLDTLKVRLANDALSTYLSDARATLAGFLEAAFPDRRGRIYSRRGAQVHPEMRSIVLNRSL
jgi:hypothetical protein